jgi:hypothetical protein
MTRAGETVPLIGRVMATPSDGSPLPAAPGRGQRALIAGAGGEAQRPKGRRGVLS